MEILPCKRTATASPSWLNSRLIDDILVEILIRLPESKTVIQFKLVCKNWNFIISSHYFFRRCIAYHRPKDNSFTLLPRFYFPPLLFPEPFLSSENTRLNLDFIPKTAAVSPSSKPLLLESYREPLFIIASFNDLLLLTCINDKDLYVVNPQTSQWISLPPPPPPTSLPVRRKVLFRYGLLCNYSDAGVRYKVIRIPLIGWFTSDNIREDEFSLQIFCSESQEWSEYSVDWYPRLNYCLCKTPIVSNNGMFHWVNGVSLVSLNPFDLVLIGDQLRPNRMIELPGGPLVCKPLPSPYNTNNILLGFGVTCGRLCVMTKVDSNHSSLRVWQLDEEASGNPWRLEIEVPPNSPIETVLVSLHRTFLAFHPYRSGVIFIAGKNFVQIDLLARCSIDLNTDDKNCQMIASKRRFWSFLPLLHQWFPTELNS